MKKSFLIALAVLVSASFNTAEAAGRKKKTEKNTPTEVKVNLITTGDSISYAAGKVRTDGLLPYLKQTFGVDTTNIADFVAGYEDAVKKGFGNKEKAYYAGAQIALMVSQRMLPFLRDEFKGRTDSVNEVLFHKGFISALKKDNSVMADSVAKNYFDRVFKQITDERDEANKKEGESYLLENAKKEGVVTLPSGLQYKVLVKGNGAIAGPNDEVTVKYEGRLINGIVFDSSYNRPGETSKFRPNQVIKGWTEALTKMPVGSKWELYIPQNLAYGERQAGKIQPYSALIFTVEVVAVDKAKEPAKAAPTIKQESVAKPFKPAKRAKKK